MKKQIILVGAAIATSFFSINAHDHHHLSKEKLVEVVNILLAQKAALQEENKYLRVEIKHELHKEHHANALACKVIELERAIAHYFN